MNNAFWKNKKVFLTGHSGFKGSWLSIMLESMGAVVKGYSLPPAGNPSLFEIAGISKLVESEFNNIADFSRLSASINSFSPDIVLHLAAQALVRESYQHPLDTVQTNVTGTANLLQACRSCESIKAVLCITSDKCYENQEWLWGYREIETLGGHDPYSASKACAELVISAWRNSFFSTEGAPPIASARAGNVIGGGDWSADRLVPDILRELGQGATVRIRSPQATRPWQHVIEPLTGYLSLCEKLHTEGKSFAEAWNFGPDENNTVSVKNIVQGIASRWGENANWELDKNAHPHEAGLLKLDCSKSTYRLDWRPKWDIETTLDHIVDWHKAWMKGNDMLRICRQQIAGHGNS